MAEQDTPPTPPTPIPLLSPQTVSIDSDRVATPAPPINSLGISREQDSATTRGGRSL